LDASFKVQTCQELGQLKSLETQNLRETIKTSDIINKTNA